MSSMNKNTATALMRAALAQHMHWLHRASSTVVNDVDCSFADFRSSVSKSAFTLLSDMSDYERAMIMQGKYNTPDLAAFKREIEEASSRFGGDMRRMMKAAGVDLVGSEHDYAHRLLAAVTEDVKNPGLAPAEMYAAAVKNPVLGMLYNDIPGSVANSAKERVFSAVRRGAANGDTTQDIVRKIAGTRTGKFKDGEIEIDRRQAEMLVRTSRTHLSNSAYEQTYAAMGVRYVVVCATLDGRTSMYCATHDGVKYKVGTAYPSPPYHPHCRTVLMPDIGGFGLRPGNTSFKSIGKMPKDEKEEVKYEMVEGMNYEQWFSNQSDSFQRRWLGKSRYELYKKGDYDIKRFVDSEGRMYTLEELRDRDEHTFNDVFGS